MQPETTNQKPIWPERFYNRFGCLGCLVVIFILLLVLGAIGNALRDERCYWHGELVPCETLEILKDSDEIRKQQQKQRR
jgi:hypothetical protein